MATLLDEILTELEYPEMEDESLNYETIDTKSKDFEDNYIDNFVRFQMMTPDSTATNHYFKIFFANGKERKFHIDDVPGNMPAKETINGVTYYKAYTGPKKPDSYKRVDGLIYPVWRGQIHFNQRFTPSLVNLKTKVVQYQEHLALMQLAAAFSNIISKVKGLKGIKTGPINTGQIKPHFKKP